jgi:hydroxymethylpyrimidine/phosphomethylpyrimidine kinase
MQITGMSGREKAARLIHSMGPEYVVLKGGHDDGTAGVLDLLYDGHSFVYLENPRIATRHTHGTGCTYSAAIAAGLAKGHSLSDAIHTAKAFIQAAIEDSLGIGGGQGPTNHFAYGNRMRGSLQ